MQINFSVKVNNPFLVIGCYKDIKLAAPSTLSSVDVDILQKTLKQHNFKAKVGEVMPFWAPQNSHYSAIFVIGLGEEGKDNSNLFWAKLGGKLYAYLADQNCEAATVGFGDHPQLLQIAYGALLRSWRFDKYRTKDYTPPKLQALEFLCNDSNSCTQQFGKLKTTAEAVFLTRTLVSEPPNVIFPGSMVERLQELSKLGVKIEILDQKQMSELGMNALLGVAQGSTKPPYLAVMQWQGASDPKAAPVAFVGKGVTFDTGGISLKPAKNMHDMKYDMAGSAVVVGTMAALAARGAKVNAVGVVGLVENMPDGNAQRPGDVVKSMSGQTIEVLNTDAEGRLVLADALWYTHTRFKPKIMVDLATLTGAIVVALGHEYAGLFANNSELADNLKAAGNTVGEKVWELPLGEAYDLDINSTVADVQNISISGSAGSITAAQFLKRFVGDTPWAHLDIAGMAWASKHLDLAAKGATAFGVRLLDHLVQNYYE